MVRFIYLCLSALFPWSLPFIGFAEKIRIELQNGGTVTGELIKQNAEFWIIDLGFDLLKIPQVECLSSNIQLEEFLKDQNLSQ